MAAENITLEEIKKKIDALGNGERLTLRHFGSFIKKVRSAHTGRNPRTGDPVDVPEKVSVKFKQSWEWQFYMNGGTPKPKPEKKVKVKSAPTFAPVQAEAPVQAAAPVQAEAPAPAAENTGGKKKILIKKKS